MAIEVNKTNDTAAGEAWEEFITDAVYSGAGGQGPRGLSQLR